MLDTWFSSALWPFATLGWPEETPELRAFYPTDVLSTARDIIFLWVARMVMMGLEFTGERPVRRRLRPLGDPGARRAADVASRSGTGIDPLDEIETHGADAVRFGLLAMSSTQDVRYSARRSQQGQALANKLWNASRLRAAAACERRRRPEPAPARRSRTAGSCRGCSARSGEATARASRATSSRHAALGALRLRLRRAVRLVPRAGQAAPVRARDDADAVGHAAARARETLALAHPVMPFVTEEIWSYLPGDRGPAGRRALRRRPTVAASTRRPRPQVARADRGGARRCARWRDDGGRAGRRDVPGAPGGRRATSRPREPSRGWRALELVAGRRDGDAVATVPIPGGAVAGAAPRAASTPRRPSAARGAARGSSRPRSRAPRASSPTSGFVAKAPPQVVEAEREKLDAAARASWRSCDGRVLDTARRPSATCSGSSCSACASASTACAG